MRRSASAEREETPAIKRREFVEKLGIGSAGIIAGTTLGGGAAASTAQHQGHGTPQVDGPLASATISFGQWLTTPALDRFTNPGNTRTSNQHKHIPYNATIKAGGSVNFMISGLHLVLVYGPGTTVESIDKSRLEFAVAGGFPGFINDLKNRIYRGPEVVTFAEPGRYFVACGLLSHFVDGMYGFVHVIR